MVDRRQHRETVYGNKAVNQDSWFQPHAASSLRLIEGCADKDAHIIDVGARAQSVQWIAGDITRAELPAARYDVWHDRAVFHFLTDSADRARYVAQLLKSVKPGGYVIVAAFGPGGPLQCSGLDVMHYAPDTLHAEFGVPFRLLRHETEIHHTPSGQEQEFVYCYCVRI